MKKTFRLLPILMMVLTLGVFSSCKDDKDNDEPSSPKNLPTLAKTFINTYFPDVQIRTIDYEKNSQYEDYEVTLANGYNITFDGKGNWTDVDAPSGITIPDGIAPQPIANYVADNYPNDGINEIEKNSMGYEVELVSGIELNFNPQGEFTGMNN